MKDLKIYRSNFGINKLQKTVKNHENSVVLDD